MLIFQCVPICPTKALDEKKVKNSENAFEIRQMEMGVAVVDVKSCVAFWGIQCDACYRACPLLGEAINIVYEKNERTGKHAFLKPVVDSDICTGCGLCEKACITEKPAIFVLPREIALGKVGDHYIKGWDEADEQRVKNSNVELGKTKINKKGAIESLNSDMKDLLDMKKYRFLIARRFTQLSIIALYILANIYGINILMGNLSSSLVLQTVNLSDPFAVLQMIFAGAIISFDIALGALIISIFYFILGGRAFCSWVCPVNIITD